MKHQHNSEVLMFYNSLFTEQSATAFLKWLVSTAHAVMEKQHESTKKIYLFTIEETSVINLS